MKFHERVDLFMQEHRNLIQDGDFIRKRLETENPATLLPELLQYYDLDVMIHGEAEERELPALARQENRNFDAEAIHFAHNIVMEEAGALRERLGDEKVSTEVLKREMLRFIQLIRDHFIEEETHLYLETQEEIDALKGSY